MARILRSPIAAADLEQIWDYIAAESSRATADRFLARIFGALDAASYAPQMGAVRSEISGSPRMLIVRPYVIFYEPLPEGDGIAIWRVLHGARQMDDLVRRPGRVS